MLPGQIALDLLTSVQTVRLESSRCVRMRFAASDCRQCEKACPHGAISLGHGPTIAPDKCTGCLLCEVSCPAGAIRGGAEKLAEVLRELLPVPRPVLGCGRQEGVSAHARVGCLGLLASPEMLLALITFLPGGLTLNLTRCRECPNDSVVTKLKAAWERVKTLPHFPCQAAVCLAQQEEELDFRERALSRREFFGFFQKKTTSTATAAIEHWQRPTAPLPYRDKRLPPARALLLDVFPAMSDDFRETVKERLFPEPTFQAGCAGCTGCVGICPTGAIEPPLEDGAAPHADRSRCTDCRLCEGFCGREGVFVVSR